jgi:3-dehydroquinate dehydratase/shikimate dehydrogenase
LSGIFGSDRVCGVAAAATAREMVRQVSAGLRKTKTLELRLDYIRSERERSTFLVWLRRRCSSAIFIATCRRREGGGLFAGGAQQEIAILAEAVRSGCGWCDVEIETARQLDPKRLAAMLSPARVMVSYHNFRRAPRDLSAMVRRLEVYGVSALKIAAHCQTVSDSARICALPGRRRNIVAIPMGEVGFAGRVLSLRTGSALAYGAIAEATAPGQLSLDAMIDLYRARRISGRTRAYGVIGDPIGHSLSPLLHNTAYAARDLDAVFAPFLVRELQDFLGAVKAFGIAGFAVTIPHKEGILRYLDGCDPLAQRIGAANTVVVQRGGKLYGYNTDYVGVLRSLERRLTLAGSRVLLYGAGGAARAAAFALVEAGAIVCIAARKPQRAEALARGARAQAIARAALRREFFDVIVNCTPAGMHPKGGTPLRAAELNCRILMDMVYRPRETELLRLARRKGIETVSGVEMFLAQGFAQHEIWTGQRAPESAMRRAVLAALEREEKSAGGRRSSGATRKR